MPEEGLSPLAEGSLQRAEGPSPSAEVSSERAEPSPRAADRAATVNTI